MDICVRNVNEALVKGCELLCSPVVRRVSPRGRTTLEWPEPVVTHYINPTERVLFSSARDANPFFHFFEALWMLAGRNDVKFVTYLVGRMSEYSDDGLSMQGAYGWRWRNAFGHDQLEVLINHLRKNPDSRRAVLQMWDVEQDLIGRGGIMPGEVSVGGIEHSADVPCNTCIYFKMRDGKLHMTVCNRSNDIIWGAYGANAVHMSMLQEYVAGRLGLQVGLYTQFSDSFHAYLGGPGGDVWRRVVSAYEDGELGDDSYRLSVVKPVPMGAEDPEWDQDLAKFFYAFDEGAEPEPFRTEWWECVVRPLWLSFKARKAGDQAKALEHADRCVATDWHLACTEWLLRRAG